MPGVCRAFGNPAGKRLLNTISPTLVSYFYLARRYWLRIPFRRILPVTSIYILALASNRV